MDQNLFMVSGGKYQALLRLSDKSEHPKKDLHHLFSFKAPWDKE